MTSEHATVYMARVAVSKTRRLLQFDGFVAENGNFIVNSAAHM